VLFLNRLRNTNFDDRKAVLKNWQDVRQVLRALTDAGFAVIGQGSVDNIVKELTGADGIAIEEAIHDYEANNTETK